LEMRLALTLSLSMNMNRKGNLLTPTLSSTSVWRRGRWNGARGFWGSMWAAGALGESDQIRPNPTCKGMEWSVDSGRWRRPGAEIGQIGPNPTESNLRQRWSKGAIMIKIKITSRNSFPNVGTASDRSNPDKVSQTSWTPGLTTTTNLKRSAYVKLNCGGRRIPSARRPPPPRLWRAGRRGRLRRPRSRRSRS